MKKRKTNYPSGWKPAKEDKIIGMVLDKKPTADTADMLAEDDDTPSEIRLVWELAVTDGRMAQMEKGDVVSITYKGKAATLQNEPVYLYEIAVGRRPQKGDGR